MDREQAQAVVRQILDGLRDVHLIRPGADPSYSVHRWLSEWFTADDRLASGVALTPLMWVPRGHWACLAQCLKSEHPYSSANALDLGLFVKLEAKQRVRVQTGEKRIPTQLRSGDAVVHSATHEIKKLYKELNRGDTIVLPAHWAVIALMAHSKTGWEPHLWEQSAAVPQRDALVEVGYELRGSTFDEPITAPKQEKRRKAS